MNARTTCPINCQSRLDREDYWIKTLLTSYPYGQNESKMKTGPNLPVACSFLPIPSRGNSRIYYSRNSSDLFFFKNLLCQKQSKYPMSIGVAQIRGASL